MLTRAVFVLLAAAAVAVPVMAATEPSSLGAAPGAPRPSVQRSPDLWATINVCDTRDSPDTIGIRGSMPGIGRPATMYMRFKVQYLAKADARWHDIAVSADSGWISVGRSRTRVVESGQNFRFLPPADGGAHRLRGVVRFKWVHRGKVLERRRRLTESGHRSTAGADPPGYSAAICDIT